MTNPNDAAFSRDGGLPADAMSFLSNSPSKAAETEIAKQAVPAPEGLTKREYFAAMTMQALLTNYPKISTTHSWTAIAVQAADALIAELNKKPNHDTPNN